MDFSDLLTLARPIPDSRLWTAAESRAFDLFLQEKHRLSAALLMENAGQATARAALRQLPALAPAPAAPILILAGPGNNGGDALVAARALHRACPHPVQVWAPLGLPAHAGAAAGQARDAARSLGIPLHLQASAPAGIPPALILDGLFGTGLTRQLEGTALAALEHVRDLDRPVLSLDLPSGLDTDTGVFHGPRLKAVGTVTYIGVKRGLTLEDGPQHAGTVQVASIGVAHALAQAWLAQARHGAL